MNFDFLSAGINVFGILVSAFLSYRISKATSSAEIKKLEATWQHEKESLADADFDKMVAAVTVYSANPVYGLFKPACEAVGVYRAKATGEMASAVDALSNCLMPRSDDTRALTAALANVIEERRKCGS